MANHFDPYRDWPSKGDPRIRAQQAAQAAGAQSLEALISARAWIEHWQEDVRCGLLPTAQSLETARVELRAAITKAQHKD